MSYVDLHAHSHFSFGDGTFSPTDAVNRAAELGRTAIALTEHGNVSSHAELQIAARKAKIKAIFGVEAYLVGDVEEQKTLAKSPDKDDKAQARKRTHLTVLSRTQSGYTNLLAGVSESWRNFYYQPLWDLGTLKKYGEGLVVLSGCLSSAVSQSILDGDEETAEAIVKSFHNRFGDDYYLETQLFDLERTRQVNAGILRIAKKHGIKAVATNDVHQRTDEDKPLRVLVHCIRDNRHAGEPASNEYTELTEYQLTIDEVCKHAHLAGLGDDIEWLMTNTLEVADKCVAEVPKSEFVPFPLPDGETDATKYLYSLLKQGMIKRGFMDKPEYVDRLVYEMQVIEDKGFVDYFLVVSDIVQWAKRRGILVGLGRGSAAGSLLSYVLGITEVDPIRYGLMFERFIDLDRIDFPDIDLDFESEAQEKVRQYITDKYGADRVALLSTFIKWGSKSSLDKIGYTYNIPNDVIAEAKGELDRYTASEDDDDFANAIEIASFKSQKYQGLLARYPDLGMAGKLEGQMRTFGTHPCGVILSQRPLNEVCAIYHPKGQGDATSSVDGSVAESLGLLKIDVLGLSSLSMLKSCMEYTGMTVDDLYNLPHDDPKVFEGFNRGDVLGIFQFEGTSMRNVLSSMPKISTVLELSHVCALCRPGPNDSGITARFLKARMGVQPPRTIHPVIDEKLAWTYGEVVYQEQVTQLAMLVGKMSGGRADTLRKAVSKKYGADYINAMRAEFVTGAVETGVDADISERLFDDLLTFGSYAFNLSHSVAYALSAYYDMYFKQHHPTAFYASILANEKEKDKRLAYLREFVSKGGKVLAPHYNKSGMHWRMEEEGVIRAGLDAVVGIGETASKIVAHQPYASVEDLSTRRVKTPTEKSPEGMRVIVTKAQVKALSDAGAFNDGDSDFMGLRAFQDVLATADWDSKINSIMPESQGEFIVSGAISGRELRSRLEQALRYGDGGKEVKDPDLDEYMSFTLSDDTGEIPVTISRFNWKRMRPLMLQRTLDGDILTVTGEQNRNGKSRRLMATKIVPSALNVNGRYVAMEDVELLTDEDKEWRRETIKKQSGAPKLRSRLNDND